MMAAMKMSTPGVLTQLNEVIPAPCAVDIWTFDENADRNSFTGGTDLDVNSKSTKIDTNGKQAMSGGIPSSAISV